LGNPRCARPCGVRGDRGGRREGLERLAASLAAHHTPVTAAERDELLALLRATGMPTDPIESLNVQG